MPRCCSLNPVTHYKNWFGFLCGLASPWQLSLFVDQHVGVNTV